MQCFATCMLHKHINKAESTLIRDGSAATAEAYAHDLEVLIMTLCDIGKHSLKPEARPELPAQSTSGHRTHPGAACL